MMEDSSEETLRPVTGVPMRLMTARLSVSFPCARFKGSAGMPYRDDGDQLGEDVDAGVRPANEANDDDHTCDDANGKARLCPLRLCHAFSMENRVEKVQSCPVRPDARGTTGITTDPE